ncbi:tetratricopeptide repeat protein [Pseudaeromonas paramecii]|uniref:Tetratricopeptide repeat protein n=1 Tax=Pseudaeromonas paramecii TaxID=2138166 RepID=A0ABP8QKB7_9GAMM
MSVINQMLRDLESRQAASGQENIYRPQPGTGRGPWWLAGIALTLLLAGALAWRLGYLGLPVQASPAMAAVSQPVAPAAVAPATDSPVTAAQRSPVAASAPDVFPADPAPPLETTAAPAESVASVPAHASLPAPVPEDEPLFVDADTLQQPVSDPDDRVAAAKPEPLQAADVYPDDDAYADGADHDPEDYAYQAPAPQSSLKIEPVQLSPAQQAALDKRQARQAMAGGDLAKAREALDRVVRATPQDHESREQLAGLLYGEGRLSEARQLLEQGMALAPNYANFRLLLARLAQAMGDKPGALAYLQGLTPPVAANLDYYATRAALAQELGSLAEAVLSYQHLTQAQPANGRWWMGLGISLDKQGQLPQAEAAYRQALARGQLGEAARQFVGQRLTQLEQ